MLRSLPWFIRLPLGLPILGVMVWAQYTAFTSQRDFESWSEGEQVAGSEMYEEMGYTVARNDRAASSLAPEQYIGAHPAQEPAEARGGGGIWISLAAGGAGLSVLAGCLALSGLFSAASDPDEFPNMSDPLT